VTTSRLETFSDSVLAVAVTLLVLDVEVPPIKANEELAQALLRQWPHYAAYGTSFITIGIIWINHSAMIGRLRMADPVILTLNLLLLLSIALLPFATSLMAAFLKVRNGQHLAAGVYAGAFLVVSSLFTVLQRYILLHKPHMLRVDLSDERRRRIVGRSMRGVWAYVLATVAAVLSAYVSLAICAALAIYYALPVAGDRAANGPDAGRRPVTHD
jgi:TMEM175 potassium channel family protein